VGPAAHADAIAAALNFFGSFLLQGKKERKERKGKEATTVGKEKREKQVQDDSLRQCYHTFEYTTFTFIYGG
jgi:hypothetical protein